MVIAITIGVAVVILGILQAILATKMIKTVFKAVLALALVGGIGLTVYYKSIPTRDTLLTAKDEIVAQVTEEIKKNGKVTDALEDKINTYNSLVDKAQAFQDNKFIGGFVSYNLDDLKIDLSEWK